MLRRRRRGRRSGSGSPKNRPQGIENLAPGRPVVQIEDVQGGEGESGEQGIAAESAASEVPAVHTEPVLLQVGEHPLDTDPAVIGRLPGQGAVLERHPQVRVVRVGQGDRAPAAEGCTRAGWTAGPR